MRRLLVAAFTPFLVIEHNTGRVMGVQDMDVHVKDPVDDVVNWNPCYLKSVEVDGRVYVVARMDRGGVAHTEVVVPVSMQKITRKRGSPFCVVCTPEVTFSGTYSSIYSYVFRGPDGDGMWTKPTAAYYARFSTASTMAINVWLCSTSRFPTRPGCL